MPKWKSKARAKLVRAGVYAGHGPRLCFYCRTEMSRKGDDPETIEHILPRSLGGTNCVENLRLAHRSCNLAVANLPPDVKMSLAGNMQRGELPRAESVAF